MTDYDLEKRLGLFPVTTRLESSAAEEGPSRLTIGGCSLEDLAEQYGTPLYLYDQMTLDQAVEGYWKALAAYYPGATGITYAGKAFLCTALAQWAQRQGLWLDCTGVGELAIAAAANVPRNQVLVHGVNKSQADLNTALAQAGTIVVDNLAELGRLARKRDSN